jgi:multisubunit Na+/H+ antiporter MnhC subunit
MGFFSRFQIVVATIISGGVVAVIIQNVGTVISDAIDANGPFGEVASQAQTLGPIVIAVLMLSILVWFIVSTVQEERTVETTRRRRR